MIFVYGLAQAQRKSVRCEDRFPADGPSPNGHVDEDALFDRIKARLIAEAPAIVRLLTVKPQLDIAVKRQTVELDGTSWVGRVGALIAEGYFDAPRRSSEVFKEATRRGATGVAPRADEACKKLLAMGFLTREEDGFRAVQGMKVNLVEAR